MASDPLFGWDLTFKTIERDIKKQSDIIIAFIHWNLTRRGFRSIGLSDERTITGDEPKSELLPEGWNDTENYRIRYVLESKLYILHGLNTDGNLIVNLMRSEDLAVTNIGVKIDEILKESNGTIDVMMPNYKDFIFVIKRDLIDSITDKPTATSETQTASDHSNTRRPSDDPLRIPPRPRPGVNPDSQDLWAVPPGRNVGHSDLDPFSPFGGGMIFNPFAPRRDIENPGLGVPGGLPRAAVPPGARFDPFAPPGVGEPIPGRRPPPDADHLPPPGGFNENMFM
ncbi:proteasome inhibitor PI31 subunit [Bombyx mandarina]|uniref:Proteasome inhibitor PI31 subunit n=2 Tax=Bombyx TaxID=7090 RepID=A0A8R1WJR8_BOMMO|nr:proteasome inhibitor PI31 subunit [Bombyx mori]XP_028029966.1 proteasome inhibitor PI31 subunit [Bombyx mandarina]